MQQCPLLQYIQQRTLLTTQCYTDQPTQRVFKPGLSMCPVRLNPKWTALSTGLNTPQSDTAISSDSVTNCLVLRDAE